MQLHKIVTLFFLLFLSAANAQKSELAKITIKDLQEKLYPADTNAVAAILYNKGKTVFRYNVKKGFSAVHEYFFRIKIYKKEGLKWGNFEIPYFVGYENLNDDRIKFSDGVTYNLENNAVTKTKLKSEGTFKKDMNEFWNVAAITMPNVKVGSIIEFSYTLKTEDLGEFPIFNFQYEIPVKHAEYFTEIPEFFIYKPLIVGVGLVKSDAKVTSGHQNFDNENGQTTNLSYQQISSSYISDNVPALFEEDDVDNIDNYRSALQHELERTRFPDVPEKNYTMTWDGVARTIFKDERFGKELEARQYFEQDLPAVVRSSKTDTDKVLAILAHVKRTIKWDGKYGYNTKKGVKKAYLERTGNVAEVNFILISMLNHAGINANPVLISTVKNGIPAFPNLRIFNYVLAAAQLDGKWVLLDATEKYTSIDILPARDLNWNGRLIRRDGSSEEIQLVPASQSRELVSMIANIDSQGKIDGKLRIQKTAQLAYEFREANAGQNKSDYIAKLENDLGDVKVDAYVCDNCEDVSKPVIETCNFASDNHVEVIGDKMFINPLLFFTQNRNPFLQENRKLPVYYGYPQQYKYNITYEIPEGYAIESLPKGLSLSTGENVGQFVFNIAANGNKIQITINKEINLALISASFYENLQAFYKQMIGKQQDKIVLKKI
jgi:hypothetical protein